MESVDVPYPIGVVKRRRPKVGMGGRSLMVVAAAVGMTERLMEDAILLVTQQAGHTVMLHMKPG